MSELPEVQYRRLTAWADKAIEQGWLATDVKQALTSANSANPGQLFAQAERPLVVGLFGGTGVGKSSLLNRLAGENVARASAERPTSRNITLYVHRSISVDRLPENFPMDRMKTEKHTNNVYQQIIFIDMPDFDSVEASNRDLVKLWLPHLDVIMYVVSPERYRDDQGWQLLTNHISEHAWLFVINQWDRGHESQREDFIDQLGTQGLSEPLVFCTDCAHELHAPGMDISKACDDFPSLQRKLISLSDTQIIDHLQKHGVVTRLRSLKNLGDAMLEPLGNEKNHHQLNERWQLFCAQQSATLTQILQWPVLQVATDFSDTKPFWQRLFDNNSRKSSRMTPNSLNVLAQPLNERLTALLNQFLNKQAFELSVPVNALTRSVNEPASQALSGTEQTLEGALGHALLNPGQAWHRKLCSIASMLCWILPLMSLLWISFRVISAFAQGGSNSAAYLGSSFAINSVLLMGISWLLPAMAHTALNPSREQAAKEGLQRGILQVAESFQARVDTALSSLGSQARALSTEYYYLWSELPGNEDSRMPESIRHMLSAEIAQPTLRALDVRANTHSSTDDAPLS